MASTGTRIRFVKCPRCLKLLLEVPDIPVYECGGCHAILRAKHCDGTGGNASSASLVSSSKKLPHSGLLSNNEQAVSREQMTPRPEELETGLEQSGSPNLQLSDSNAPSNSQEKLESSEQRENGIEGTHAMNSIAQSQSVEVTQAKAEQCLNEGLEKSPKISQESRHGISLSNRMQEAARSNICSIGLEDGVKDFSLRSSSMRSSSAYINGAKTFRAPSLDHQNDRLKCISDIAASVDLKKNVSSSRRENLAREWLTSLDSEAFHSVHSWMEPERDGHSRSPSEDSIFRRDSRKYRKGIPSTKFRYLKREQRDVLRLVDELRDQLKGLFGQTVNTRGRSYIGGTQQKGLEHLPYKYKSRMQATEIPNSNFLNHLPRAGPYNMHRACPPCVCLHCYHGSFKACSNNVCSHLSKDPCTSHHKAQAYDGELEKSHQEERRKPAKHHCRPASGGSPFVICYKCSTLLQLPADFLVSRKVLHKLQCGACLEVLTFSFHARPHKIPQTPPEVQHPPSEASASRSCDLLRGDPVLYADDGASLDKSCLTEAKAPKLHPSRDSSEPNEERHGKRVSASSLHRLMGYSSASELVHQPVNAE